MSDTTKDTIYIDVENDITEVISKIVESKSKIIALVIPKRSSTLQSIVNLKLLKRSTKASKKNLVLVTSDPRLLPLAGLCGVYVAKTPTSKPFIPNPPETNYKPEEVESLEGVMSLAATEIQDTPISNSSKTTQNTKDYSDSGETIVVESNETSESQETDEMPDRAKEVKNKKLKIPNFNRFRVKLFMGMGILLIISIGCLFAFVILPKADVVVSTDTSNLDISINITGNVSANKLDIDKLSTPIVKKELSKSETETVSATGERDEGTRASGDMTLSIPCSDVSGTPPTIPSGTGVSVGNTTYITQTSVSLTTPSFNSGCTFVGDTTVTARENGDQYNQTPKTYTIAGFSSVTGFGGAITGGSSKKIKFVTQSDIDGARQKILDKVKPGAQAELESQFNNEVLLLKESFVESEPAVTANPSVNSPNDTVTVTLKVVYSELAVSKANLISFLDNDTKRKIDTNQQMIQDNGIDGAKIRITSALDSSGNVKFQLSTIAISGPQIDASLIKDQIKGKSKTEAVSILKARQGVKDVDVQFSPFWVSSLPGSASKINVSFEKSE